MATAVSAAVHTLPQNITTPTIQTFDPDSAVVPAAFYLFERKRVTLMEERHSLMEADGGGQQ